MNNLTHEQAREFIQHDHLSETEIVALRQHLAKCDECRSYATLHVQLRHQLVVNGYRQRPTPAEREAILAAGRVNQNPRFWRPLATAGGLVAVLFLITVIWITFSAAQPIANQPTEPVPQGTTVPLIEPLPTSLSAEVTPSPTSQVTPDPRGTYMIDTVPAPSLAGNLIGEPLEQQVVVYLPPSYQTGDRHYPVVYALFTTSSLRIHRDSESTVELVGTTARSAMNLALRAGSQEMIIVMPDLTNNLGLLNYYVNSPVTGNLEDYLAIDLVDYIDANYRTIPAKESRAIFGEYLHALSALVIGAHHPEVFGAVSVLHPVIDTPEQSIIETTTLSPLAQELVQGLFAEAQEWPADKGIMSFAAYFPQFEYVPLALSLAISYGMAFVPNVEGGAPFFSYPYPVAGDPPDVAILQRWKDGLGNINEKLQPYADALQTLHITIDYYEDVAGYNRAEPLYLSEQLSNLNIPHSMRGSDLIQPSTVGLLGRDILPDLSQILSFD
ncbi:MAG: alpha/beta hydrolase-fold protein [Chloroflexota bacterium]|jgi:hypothetical protein